MKERLDWILVGLRRYQIKRLNMLRPRGISRSSIIREAIDEWIEKQERGR